MLTKRDNILTISGQALNPYHHQWSAKQIFISDIAQALAQLNCYGGHTRYPYSVAQHSLNCATWAQYGLNETNPQALLAVLLYRAYEAYTGAVPVSVKKAWCGLENLEALLNTMIQTKYQTAYFSVVQLIEQASAAITAQEAFLRDRKTEGSPLFLFRPMTADLVKFAFLRTFVNLRQKFKAN